ncbi:MAG: diaminopimelate decarboxylase [Gemmatimonadales bacterium]|nr:diaminopimelate decarboxylase [Gemmatimonadales bacterium]
MAGVPLASIADAVGTPAYVYNADAICARYAALDEALGGVPHRICFAVKANSNLAVLRVLRDLGAGADIVSAGELARALAAGFAPGRIVFSGVGKTADELRAAVRARVGHINLESVEELDLVAAVATEEGLPVSLGIRVNPDVTTETHPYISTGKSGIKFGVPTDQVSAAVAVIAAHPLLSLTVVAMHLGSQLNDTAPFIEGIARLREIIAEVRAAGIGTLEVLDIGGGLGIRYGDNVAMEAAEFATAVVPALKSAGLTVYLEPGRFLVGSAGVLLGTVLYRKHSGGKSFVISDIGMNDLVRPSHYLAHHEIVEVERSDRPPSRVDVVGPVCETGDFIALDRELPGVQRGDRIAVLGAGAYGFVMASNYNTRPRPPEVMVGGGRFAIARPREELAALFHGETPDPFG